MRFVHLMIATVIVWCVAGPAWAEEGHVRIEVIATGEGLLLNNMAELESLQNRQKFGSAELPQDGALHFRNIPYGEYRLTIVDGTGVPVYEQLITVGPSASTIMVRLHKKESPRPLSGTVSLLQLQNPIRKKALQSFGASQKLINAGQDEK